MNKTGQHTNRISRKALTIALVCAFVIQPFMPLVAQASASGAVPVGYLDSASCSTFTGWTYDADNSSVSTRVDFYTDISGAHTFITSIEANTPRADVNATEGVSGDHGFSVATPDIVKDGQNHLIYAYGIDTNGSSNSLLNNSPIQISGCTTGGVTNTAPVAPTVAQPASVVVDVPASFSASATDPQGDQVTYGFDWNNDTVVDTNDYTSYVASGASASISHPFTTAGTHTVNVYARDVFGLFSPATTIQVSVSAAPSGGGGGSGATNFISAFNISPTVIQSGQTALISWTASSNATACVASGDWSGDKAMSGPFNIGVQNVVAVTTKTYTLECGNGLASTTLSQTLTINPISGGGGGGGSTGGSVASFFATPSTITSGNGSVLTWSSTNATLCVASGAWVGNQNTSGNYTIAPITTLVPTTVTYYLACGNAFGTTTDQVVLTVNPTVVVPVIDFSVSPISGLSTSESGATASFAVALTSVPTANVILPIMSSNFAEGTTSVISLVFTTANWNLPQDVVVTGIDDTITDGPISYTIRVGASVSADAAWNNLSVKTVGITNTDNESVVVVTGGGTSGGTTHRGGGGGGGPCVGYGCLVPTTTTTTITPVTPPVATTGSISGPELVCPTTNFITSFMRIGIDNNPNEVRKLQYFLNTYEGAHLIIDGDFNAQTEASVMALQATHSKEILAPWGVTLPTGIVYITTARYINRVFCGDNPSYNGNSYVKDIVDTSITNTPVDNSIHFEGVVGQATTTNTSLANIGGVFGAMSDGVWRLIKDIPWYQYLILLLILIGTWFIISIGFRKDLAQDVFHMSLIRGGSSLAIGSVLNVLNTLSFILNPRWFMDKAGFGLGWLLALDIVNLCALILICLTMLITLYNRVVKSEIN